MKPMKKRLLSLLLTLVTILSLLPTSAFAASKTGSGIQITQNQAYWSTRLLANGTPYSYRPPLVDGKLVYCMDSGLGYHYATATYLDSFTWTSGTGADADAVLQSALTLSGLSEMDAATVENIKWMMTYLNECKSSNVGQLFMAVQTYVWENQSYKGEPGGDGDAGGYANADTYELYLSLIDSLLAKKAAEDAEFQRQIEEYKSQGIRASIVEDESAKWAVFAISSNRKNQSFFNYYGPRKLVTGEPAPDQPEQPAGGTGKIVLKKTAGGTTTGLAGARFSIYFNGQIVGSDITNAQGEIYVEDAATGLWSFVETSAPDGYCVDPTPKSVYVDVTEGDREYTVAAINYEKPDMKIIKRDAMSGKPIADTVFSIKSVTGSYSTSVTTGTDGSATLSSIPADVYVVREESVPEPYIVSNTEQTVALRPGKTSEVTFVDYEKPGLEIIKKNIANGEPIEGVTYRIEQIDGSFETTVTTDLRGRAFLADLPVGSYRISEAGGPSHVVLSEIPQVIYLEAGCTRTVTFFNTIKPTLTILKQNSVTSDPLPGAKLHIYYASDNTSTGEMHNLGVFYSNEEGKVVLTDAERGWYKIVEESCPQGFGYLDGESVQEFYLEENTSKTIIIRNVPLSALVGFKYDAKSGKGIPGCRFELRYLSGNTSGTGGTVIGTYVTGPNGAFTVTGLKKGTYICEEVSSDGSLIIDREPQTVWISGEDQDVVTLRFGNAPLGSLLITKLSDDSKHEPLSGVEFLLTDSSGHYLGNDNGRFTTNAAGEILVDGLEPGMTVIAREVRAKTGYLLDDSPQHALIKSGETAHLQFLNQPAGNLIIRKVSSGPNGEPLEGVEFKITYADGSFVPDANGELSSNGIYYTNKSGEIRISGVVGTVVATETKTIPGFTIDEATRTQTVVVNPNDTQTLTFYNKPTTTLILQKYISGTKNEPLAGVQFLVTDSSGAVVGPNNGYYTTDAAGQIVIEGLTDGMTVTAKEVKSVDGFVLDGTPQSIKIDQSQSPQRMTFWNERQGALIINKLSSLDRKTPLEGVTFKITTATGEFVPDENGKISSNGLYYTDENGQIILKGVTGTLVVTEEKSISGYTIDEKTRTQTVVVNPNDTQSLYFYNAPIGGLELVKVNAADKTQRIPNTTFEIRRVSDGGLVDTVTTGTDGRLYVPLASDSYYAVETEAGKGYQLDNTPIYFTIVDGRTTTKTVTNKAVSGILIHKIDSTTGEGIYGVSFILYDSGNNPIAQETSDDRGYVRFENLTAGRFYLRELENEGYIPDTQKKTVYVKSGETTEIEWKNTPITGQLQVTKVSADYNSMNGWPAGTPIPNTVFEVYNARTNRLVDTIKTDKNGLAVSKPLPLARYKIVESKAAEFYGLDKTPIEVEIEHAGQIVKAVMTNKSLSTNVSIKKTGYVEVMPGQLVRYNFADIANNSTTALESFYWRDTLPVKAVRLEKIYTGTWNTPGNYKIVYRTNLSGDTWRTLADNLSTSKNYVLDASPAALGLAANEYVTEFMAAFGIVPSNFRQVEAPRVDCKVLSKLTGGTQFVNTSDAGGVYNGQWIMATSRWVTRVYAPSKPLPRTGY